MGKIIFVCLFVLTKLISSEIDVSNSTILQNKCLSCHKSGQIPDELIYRRYLMVYSTQERMENAIFVYMKNPNKKNSVMHHPFFFKFPMKKKSNLDDETLRKMINAYLVKFDIKSKFIEMDK